MKASYSPQVKMRVPWAELNKKVFWKGIRGYEACIKPINCQKTLLKSRQQILRAMKSRKTQFERTKNTQNMHSCQVKENMRMSISISPQPPTQPTLFFFIQ
jgi:hypothetical protein